MHSIRVAVVGQSGTGKSTFADRLSERLEIPRLELDSIFHQPNWSAPSVDFFRSTVFEFVNEFPSWAIDGNYGVVRPIIWARATHVVWLDLPRALYMRRVIARSIRRILFRTQLWNGNREGFANLFSLNSERNVALHAWRSHADRQNTFSEVLFDEQWQHIRFIRVRNEHEVTQCLDRLARVYSAEFSLDV